MARFGELPVNLSEGVKAEIKPDLVVIAGPKGSLEKRLPFGIKVEEKDGNLLVHKKGESKRAKALQGTIRSHLKNMVTGVTEGWQRQLEVVGAEYKVELKGDELILNLGYSNPVVFKAPEGIKFSVEKSIITIEGIDLEKVSQLAAKVRAARKPDPYKGKGVKYLNEVIRKKPGKQAAKLEGAA